jgi:(2R)-sulfolactate sulfo-lyase subunit alpha
MSETIPNIPHFLVHSPKDNVGVVVIEDLKAGTEMFGVITETDSTTKARANHDIPIGHKVALSDLKKGDTVIKYGADVGRIMVDAKAGDHVHVHNMKTKRW